jgi:uncharacterized protein YdeI (YjbR/CyaY-like superfamily)
MDIQEKVKDYIDRHADKREMLEHLRELVLSISLVESLKWGIPVYTLDGKNVVGIAAFKNYAALWFFQGALLKDKDKRLVNAQEGKTQALRQWHFKTTEEIDPALVKAYLEEAITNQKAGKQINASKNKILLLPEELKNAMEEDAQLDAAFAQLSPGKQREYAEHIAGAKQAETRVKRLGKCIPLILEQKGLNDKYKKG